MRQVWLTVVGLVAAGGAQAAESSGVQWMRKPSIDQYTTAYPLAAAKLGKNGSAVIVCVVALNGSMKTCKVSRESPTGLGFGDAALNLAPFFIMKPETKDGVAVESEVTIPIRFDNFGQMTSQDSAVSVTTSPPWLSAPTAAEVAAAFPAQAVGKVPAGHVSYQCDVTKAGRLKDCQSVTADVRNMGFERAARSLTPRFLVDPEFVRSLKTDLVVNIQFQMMSPDNPAWSGRYLTKVRWLKAIDLTTAQALYPDKAAKAGVLTGVAVADCLVAETGGLTGCQVISETPPDLGFGDAAKAVAGVFVARLWTDDGLPAAGARVRMPVRLQAAPAAPTRP